MTVAEFLVKFEHEKWMKENQKMIDDIHELCTDAMMFKIKWGMPVSFVIDEDITTK